MKIGIYKARAIGVDFGETQNGNEYIAVGMRTDTGDVDTWTGYLSEKCVARSIHAVRLMGWKGSDLSTLSIGDLPGWVQIDVRLDKDKEGNTQLDDDGQPRTRVAFINSLSGMRSPPLSADKRKALALRLRKAVADSPTCDPVLTVEDPKPAQPKPPMREPGDDGDEPPPWL